MNPKILSMGGVFAFQLLGFALLILAVRSPEKYGFLLLGAAIGWLLYFFMRKYRVFSPKSLGATLSAVLGGEALAWLSHLRGGSTEVELQYFTGLGAGFFAYALYAGMCSWLYAVGVIPSQIKFQIAVACGAGVNDDLDEMEDLMAFEEKANEFIEGYITAEQLRDFANGLTTSRRKLSGLIHGGSSDLSEQALVKLREAKILPLLGDP
jgi:hypothetical protein